MKGVRLFVFFLTYNFLCHAQDTPQWLRYAAISPDGGSIVFSANGDLYTVPASGGDARVLTLSDAYDYMPIWSPDGSKIAFASNRYGNLDIFVMSAAGGEAIRLTYHSTNDIPCDFTPDGKSIIYNSSQSDDYRSAQHPTGALPELYQVSVTGGREKQILSVAATWSRYSKNGKLLAFQDKKGNEDEFRKHHTSSVTRDIWLHDFTNNSYKKLTDFEGEDLNPVFAPGDKTIYFTSERNGSSNVYSMDITGAQVKQITQHMHHPVRHLSCSNNGIVCYTLHGDLYILKPGGSPEKVKVRIATDTRVTTYITEAANTADEFAISPNGKEIAYVSRGEVFVASVSEGTTKRITNTPEQERSVSFSPDGRALLYSGERNGSWNIYESKLERKEENFFFNSTLLKEKAVLETAQETFQPSYSPDGKEVAYLENRTSLKVINLASRDVREIVPGDKNYSYTDGDQYYEWSPDGKWFLVNYLPGQQWIGQIGLVSSDGKGSIKNLSESGYGAYGSSWMMEGKMYIYFSDRDGMKNHASWGRESDVYAQFLTKEAWDEFNMSEEEYTLFSDAKKKKEEEEKKQQEEKGEKKEVEKAKKEENIKSIKIDMTQLEDRKRRLTIHSSDITAAYVTKDGSKLYYLAKFEKGYDLWQTNLRTSETKIHTKLNSSGGALVSDKEGKNLFILSDGKISKIDIEKGESKTVDLKGEISLNRNAERAYLFEHIWRQVREKLYVADLNGVKWDFYKSEYQRVLPAISTDDDFARMMSEMLGELNVSHTGARYRPMMEKGDATASLGLYFDNDFEGNGLKITDIISKSPVIKEGSKIQVGNIIEKIDGAIISADVNYYVLLNRKAGANVLLSLYNPISKERWEEIVKPISPWEESQLKYERWVEKCRAIVDSVSNGRIGYVHVRGMDDRSYRTVYDEALGKNAFKEALIVDTRYNGGGWLHDDLATFLNGKEYITMMPRGQNLGNEPQFKWAKPSCVVMNEFNYSDAHLFPYTYSTLGIGKLVGMPVPGTGTAVWWERLQNGVVFGIPQVGMIDTQGDYLENKQLEPDLKIANDYNVLNRGRDQQLEEAVKLLLKN